MGLFPEKEPKTNVIERPDEASPLEIERKEVATPTPTHFKAQVTNDQGQPLIQTPQTQKVTVTIPASSEEALNTSQKGKKDEATTWNASFWIRFIQKALHLGKKILFLPDKVDKGATA